MVESRVVVYGVDSGYVWDIVESAQRANLELTCTDRPGGIDETLPNFVVDTALIDRDVPFLVGGGSVDGRWALALRAHADGWTTPQTHIDPTAVTANTTEFGHGVFVNAGVVIGAKTSIGCFVNINRAASIGHHTTLATGVRIGPGATLAGRISVGAGAFIGAGAVVLPHIHIGAGATVGAGAVVTKDVEPGAIVTGNPAKIAKSQEVEDRTCPFCATT
jgi:sugar O-acyltransferase (sialic acid O-acetyltransferase NeuD family)